MNKKIEPIIVVPENEEEKPYSAEAAKALYIALYTDWRDADILLETLGFPLERNGELRSLSQRIEDALQTKEEKEKDI